MKTIKLSDIIIKPNRQRREFDATALSQLKQSIKTKGLMHPVVMENDQVTLAAGERRVRAVKLLSSSYQHDGSVVPEGHIPYICLGDLSPIDIREAELEENTHRADLSWQEKAAALQELHELRSEQTGGKQTLGATASEVFGGDPTSNQRAAVSEALTIAKHLDDPEIAKATSQKEAIKILEKKKKQEHNAKLAEIFGSRVSSVDHQLLNGDMRIDLLELPSNVFSCVVADPPYGVGADEFGSQSYGHNYEDSEDYAIGLVEFMAEQLYRVCLPQAHLYMFCDFSLFSRVSTMLQDYGWDVWPRPLIWSKHGGMLPRPEHGPRNTYECIIFANKGNKKVNAVYPDVIEVANVTDREHGAQKPVDLYIDLFKRSTMPGDHVLDPCAGSGTIFPAANRMRLKATGIEKDASNYAIALRRIDE